MFALITRHSSGLFRAIFQLHSFQNGGKDKRGNKSPTHEFPFINPWFEMVESLLLTCKQMDQFCKGSLSVQLSMIAFDSSDCEPETDRRHIVKYVIPSTIKFAVGPTHVFIVAEQRISNPSSISLGTSRCVSKKKQNKSPMHLFVSLLIGNNTRNSSSSVGWVDWCWWLMFRQPVCGSHHWTKSSHNWTDYWYSCNKKRMGESEKVNRLLSTLL